MENEKQIHLNVAAGVAELIIRHADALDEQPVPELIIIGGRDTVIELLKLYPELTQGNHTVIMVDYSNRKLEMQINPQGTEKEYSGTVTTKYVDTEEFKTLGFNSKYWPSKELGNFLRLNEHILADANKNIKGLIGDLRNLDIEYERKYKEESNNRGNVAVNKSQVIKKCNIPERISFKIPIFENEPPQVIEAEVEIDPDSLKIVLIVPNLNNLIKETITRLIEDEVKLIKGHEAGVKLPIFYIG